VMKWIYGRIPRQTALSKSRLSTELAKNRFEMRLK
jgi:hypothetical protein